MTGFRIQLRTVLFAIAVSAALQFIASPVAFADYRRWNNDAEETAHNKCTAGARGAMWFALPGTSYYTQDIVIENDATSVSVRLRGSGTACYTNKANEHFYAIEIDDPDDRLTVISPTSLYRGRWDSSTTFKSGDHSEWTSQGDEIGGNLYVGDLATGPNGGVAYIQVNIWRCPSEDGSTRSGPASECYASPVDVKVTRKKSPKVWTISGDTDVVYNGVTKYYNGEPQSDILVYPNSSVGFRHYIKNNGPDATDAASGIWSDTRVSGGLGTAKGGVGQGNLANGAKRYSHSDNISIGNVPLGSRYCQRVGYQPRSSSDGNYGNGPNRCVRVNYSYNLTPVVTANPAHIALAGQDLTFSYQINNNTSYFANPTNWSVRQTVTSPTGVVTSTNIQSGTNTFAGSWTPRPTDTVSNTFPAGSTVCRYLSVNSSTEQPNVPAEAGACVLVAYSPYFTAVGGNVWAGGSTVGPGYTGIGSVSGNAPSTFGSFGEYGVFATGDVTNFGSGGLLGASGLGMTNGSRLTFANVSPKLGSFSSSHRIPERSVPTGSLPPNKNWSQVMTDSANEVFYIPGNGNYDIDAAELPLGKRITIYANNRTVRINGNITYAAGATGFAQLPSLTVVAKSIEVGAAASEVSGYFYVTDSFVTCSEGPRSSAQNGHPSMGAITTTGPCYTPLTVNGAVTVANNGSAGLVLNRSSGGDASGTPAEMFRMRPEVFLTGYEESRAADSLVITTVHETELSPRY